MMDYNPENQIKPFLCKLFFATIFMKLVKIKIEINIRFMGYDLAGLIIFFRELWKDFETLDQKSHLLFRA